MLIRVTLQVALVYTPLVLLFHNNQGKVALVYTPGKVALLYTMVVVLPQQPRQYRIARHQMVFLLLLTSVKHPPGILSSMSDFKILH